MNTTILYAFESKSILKSLNAVIERLAVLEAAGINVPMFHAQDARDALLRVLVVDAVAEQVPGAVLLAAE